MQFRRLLIAGAVVCTTGVLQGHLFGQSKAQPSPRPVLVELFTSEGCSSCPPADAILREIDGRRLDTGQVIVGLSEHVTYWNHDGWKDPFSQPVFTARQNDYGGRFHLDSVYTPQMVVDGEAQVNGSDGRALLAAIRSAEAPSSVVIHIDSATLAGNALSVTFSVAGDVPRHGVDIYAVVADDQDTSNVLRGENKGRTITHVSVARSLVRVASLKAAESKTVTVPLPAASQKRHLVLFAQEPGPGRVLAIATEPLSN